MDEWVYGCADRSKYIDHYVLKFGSDVLARTLKARPYYSSPANYGGASLFELGQ